jgi:hypothetical protein
LADGALTLQEEIYFVEIEVDVAIVSDVVHVDFVDIVAFGGTARA